LNQKKNPDKKNTIMTMNNQLKTVVAEAIAIIRENTFTFTVDYKPAYDPDKTELDPVTIADKKAQEHVVRRLTELFPTHGIVAEEALTKPINGTNGAFFTIDPLDGTKAFVRRQSEGIGSMIALVEHGTITAAYVGNVTTGEIYGYGPDDNQVYRTMYGTTVPLRFTTKPLHEQYAQLRTRHEDQPPLIKKIIAPIVDGGLVKSYEIMGGSVGTWLARLWKGEVAMAVFDPAYATPWDYMPIVGISEALGFKFYKIEGNILVEYAMPATKEIVNRDFPMVATHPDYARIINEHTWK
jgi:fructose-1,6-bisphosphatase/inositol monophosphatase family enzyme